MYPLEQFSEEARKTLTLAQEEAESAHRSYIGTEHLLLGILRNQDGIGSQALNGLGIQTEDVRRAIVTVVGHDERTIVQQTIPTSRVKKVMELAFEEARRMRSPRVTSGHILMGLVIEGEGIAAHVLQGMGAGREEVIAAVEQAIGFASGGVPTESGAEALLQLLRRPEIANLLRAKGLLDVEGLAARLEEPPPDIVNLRLEVQDLRNQLNVALAQLSRAEHDWLRKLTE